MQPIAALSENGVRVAHIGKSFRLPPTTLVGGVGRQEALCAVVVDSPDA
ncbi:MAG: hypothetical protein OXC07_01895 [Kistimonas sp.]|nr:hypothetical protein [Kistimonas sp.]